MKTVKIAIQKSGRLNEKSVEFLKNCGLSFENYTISLTIAAMAYGTESIPKVDKTFGPGNQYVTKAKTMI